MLPSPSPLRYQNPSHSPQPPFIQSNPLPLGPALQFIQNYATGIIEAKLDAYCLTTGRDIESLIARDDYLSSLSDLQFRNGLLNAQTYYTTITKLFTFPTVQSNPEALVKSAESLILFHQNLTANISPDAGIVNMSWEALTTALGNLTKASKLEDVENLAAVHVLRGDVEMLRYQMGQKGWEVARKSGEVLVKNAEVFYRGGKNVAKAAGEMEVEMEGTVKEGIVKGLRGDGEGMKSMFGGLGESEVGKILAEMVDDGVVEREQLEGLGIAL